MIKETKETDFPPGEEGNSSEIGKVVTTSKASSSSTPIITTTNPTPWLRVKDPRIVRVSRVFGGKDRHSKVCTVRGLRDRRVRLSVPTAIRLYDLQDRLGLNQPSKVVDWLIDAAKNEIDELPPLPMLPGNFSLLMPREANVTSTTTTPSNASQANDHQGLAKNNSDHHGTTVEWDQLGSSSRLGWSNFWSTTSTHTSSDSSTTWRTRSNEVMAREMADEKENLRGGTRNSTSVNDHQGQAKEEGGDIIGNNLLQRTNMIGNHHHPFFPGMLNNIANNLANGYRWESPDYPLLMSHLGTSGAIGHGLADHNLQGLNNIVSLQPSTLSLSTGSQYLLCPHGSSSASTNATATTTTTTQTYFPNLLEIHDPRQANHFQMLSSNSAHQNLLPNQMRSLFHFDTSNSPTNDNGNSSAGQSKERE